MQDAIDSDFYGFGNPQHESNSTQVGIKLGNKGSWANDAIKGGYLALGYDFIDHKLCEAKNWDEVKIEMKEKRPKSVMAGVKELKKFYESGSECLWIAFYKLKIYWCFCDYEVKEGAGDQKKKGIVKVRKVTWRNTDIKGNDLEISKVSTKLTKVASYQGTICSVNETAYLLRQINAEENPVLVKAAEAKGAMIKVAEEMISWLHQDDFETLADLIFSRSGWERSTRVGGKMADIDIEMHQHATGEKAFVQVKSQANQKTFEKCIGDFDKSGCDRMFFVCHTAQGKQGLTQPEDPRIHLFEGKALAKMAVKSGLFDWLIERSR